MGAEVKQDRDDKAAIAIAPLVLDLNEKGEAELKRLGLERYCSEAELMLLYRVVAIVERVFIENPYKETNS